MYQFSSVAQLCLTLCDLMDCSTPGFPVHHQLPELLKLVSIESLMPSSLSSSVVPFSSCLQPFLASGSFPMSQLFASGSQSIGVSASASVFPVNIQDWFPLGLTGLILQSKDSQESSQKPQFKSINSWVYIYVCVCVCVSFLCICPFRFFSHIGHHRVLSRVPCGIREVLISRLFCI